MNIFSEDDFLTTFGDVYFPGQPFTTALFELDGKFWKLPTQKGEPLSGADFVDFFEPIADQAVMGSSGMNSGIDLVRYLSQASYQMVSCAEWPEFSSEKHIQPSPTILWGDFDTWEAFIKHARQKESRVFSDARRRQRKLEQEVGVIQINLNDLNCDALETCFRWKSEQLQRNELDNPFANPKNLQFLRELAARKIITVSSLSAGNTLLAVHIFMLKHDRFYSWITTYDPAYSRYAPGRLLLHRLLEESFRQKHQEFDFLLGGEDYKWNYATHVRLIVELGVPPLPERMQRSLISLGGKALTPFPKLRLFVKQMLHLS